MGNLDLTRIAMQRYFIPPGREDERRMRDGWVGCWVLGGWNLLYYL
jgi:hypothetical protein